MPSLLDLIFVLHSLLALSSDNELSMALSFYLCLLIRECVGGQSLLHLSHCVQSFFLFFSAVITATVFSTLVSELSLLSALRACLTLTAHLFQARVRTLEGSETGVEFALFAVGLAFADGEDFVVEGELGCAVGLIVYSVMHQWTVISAA